MSVELKHYIRALEPAVQTALLLRIRAFAEPNEDTAFEILAEAKKCLLDAALTSEVARYLLNCERRNLGWGVCKPIYTIKSTYSPYMCHISNSADIYKLTVAENELYNGNPLSLATVYLTYPLPRSEAFPILYMLGFSEAVPFLAGNGSILQLRNYCRGLNMFVLECCATQSLENLVYVFGLLRRRRPTLVREFHHVMDVEQENHIETYNCEKIYPHSSCINCQCPEKTAYVLRFIDGWCARDDPVDGTPYQIRGNRDIYLMHTSVYQKAVVNWLLCARVLGVHKDIARVIGKQIYEWRFDLDDILSIW